VFGKPCLATLSAGTLSQPRCSTMTLVSSPTDSKRTSTSVSCPGAKVAWRQPNTSRSPGSQTLIRPISNTLPLASVSMNRPPSPGSMASTPGPRGVKANRALGFHHSPTSPTNTSNARSGDALTRRATRTFELTPRLPPPGAP